MFHHDWRAHCSTCGDFSPGCFELVDRYKVEDWISHSGGYPRLICPNPSCNGREIGVRVLGSLMTLAHETLSVAQFEWQFPDFVTMLKLDTTKAEIKGYAISNEQTVVSFFKSMYPNLAQKAPSEMFTKYPAVDTYYKGAPNG